MTSKLPLRHLSIRVPWHDAGWNGTVCQNPKGNAACLVLKEIRDTRDDDRQQQLAGQSIATLDQTTQWPACIGERATFMAPFEFTRMVKHPYASFSDAHSHITPASFRHPAYSAATIPFRWMSRDAAWELAEELDLDVDPQREPMEGWLERNNWVQDHHNQRALLDGFARDLEPSTSLVFFYAKQTPLSDGLNRQIVAVAKLSNLGGIAEYPYEGGSAAGRIRSTIWERAFQHSLRPHPDVAGAWLGGVVLPYHGLLEQAKLGILVASLVAGVVGYALMSRAPMAPGSVAPDSTVLMERAEAEAEAEEARPH